LQNGGGASAGEPCRTWLCVEPVMDALFTSTNINVITQIIFTWSHDLCIVFWHHFHSHVLKWQLIFVFRLLSQLLPSLRTSWNGKWQSKSHWNVWLMNDVVSIWVFRFVLKPNASPSSSPLCTTVHNRDMLEILVYNKNKYEREANIRERMGWI
jgi:hypothetical protein